MTEHHGEGRGATARGGEQGGGARRYRFFNHAACEYYPCHDMEPEKLNCLFCFCPLYCLGTACGGNFSYVGGVKDCSACTVPHRVENYDYLMAQFPRISALGEKAVRGGGEASAAE